MPRAALEDYLSLYNRKHADRMEFVERVSGARTRVSQVVLTFVVNAKSDET